MNARFALVLSVVVSVAASLSSDASELIRRAPVHAENADPSLVAQGFAVADSAVQFAGQTGCCEREPSCCDNIWAGYCSERVRWCDQVGGCDSCDSCSRAGKTSCNHRHAQKGGRTDHRHGKGKGGACQGCTYSFGLVRPCGGGKGCGKSGHHHAVKGHVSKIGKGGHVQRVVGSVQQQLGKLHLPHASGKGKGVRLPQLKMPHVKLPQVKFPMVKLPPLKLPQGKDLARRLPKWKLPQLKLPHLGHGKHHHCHDGCSHGTVYRHPYENGPGYGYLNSHSAPVYLAPPEALDQTLEGPIDSVETNRQDETAAPLAPADPTA